MPSNDELQGLTPADRDPRVVCDDCPATLDTREEAPDDPNSDWYYHVEPALGRYRDDEVVLKCPNCRDDGGESA